MDLKREEWTKDDYAGLRIYLIEQTDEKYREFNEKIVNAGKPTLGIRIPILRKMAKDIIKGNPQSFVEGFAPEYHEEKILLGAVIAGMPQEYEEFLNAFEGFLPLIDNWAICDILCGSITKAIKSHRADFFGRIEGYLESENHWIIRVGIVSMISQYMDKEYIPQCLQRTDRLQHSFYYVKMAQAWLVSAAMVKMPEVTKEYLQSASLDKWTFNKAIQKSRESFRVSEEDKALLKTWKK